MKNLTSVKSILLLFVLVILGSCREEVKSDRMPVSAKSEEASQLYREAITALDDLYLDNYLQLLEKTVDIEQDFFMANYLLAIYFKWYDTEKFTRFANNAINTETELSDAEELLKIVLVTYLEDPKADVQELGLKLVELYPLDVEAYIQLAYFQIFSNNIEGQLATYRKALEVAENKAPIYNMLGYTLMTLENFDEADWAFKKYLELNPDIPNAYDSQGDYFMAIDEYEKAYESYMKAYEIDSLWSYEKALKAKEYSSKNKE
jgi:tetratricopeptide (TPR) repeat protein